MTSATDPARLARGGALSAPLAGALWWLIWTVWWFAAGVLVGLDWKA